MATTTQTALITNILAQPSTFLAAGTQEARVVKSVYTAATTAEKTVVGTFSGTINNVLAVMPLNWKEQIRSIQLTCDDMDTNGTPTLTLDIGVGHIDRNTGTVTVDAATVYASAATTAQSAAVRVEMDARAADTAADATVLTDSGLTVIPASSIPVLIFKAHAAAATAVAAPKFKVEVTSTLAG